MIRAFVVLPILALLLLFLVLPKVRLCWRVRALGACVLWGVLVALITEGLSLFRLLTAGWVSAAWLAAVLVLLCLLRWPIWMNGRDGRTREASGAVVPRPLRLAVAAVGLVVALTGLVAFIAPPNNWDSMSYHMARVAHWIQNGTVRHYPTSYLPQLYHPPWAEFAILHLQILSGGDRFANGVQWMSMVGSILGASLIAKLLGADQRAQAFASVLAATIPMGILQASSTQNDFVVAFWLVCFVICVLRLVTSTSDSPPPEAIEVGPALAAGVTLGLALLTKGSAYICAAPFVLWVALVMIRRSRWRAVAAGLVIGSVLILLNGGHFYRNTRLFGSPVSSAGERWFVNEVHTPAAFASNVIRNVSLHMGTPVAAINAATESVIQRLHDGLGLAVDDPRTSSTLGDEGFTVPVMNTWEESAGNPLHAVMILVSIAVLVFRRSVGTQPHVGGYLLSLCAAFVLFNMLLKWQPWNSRVHLPLFVLFAPFVAVVVSRWRARQVGPLIAMLAVASLPWLLANRTRPLLPVFTRHPSILAESRLDQYFSTWSSRPLKKPYLEATAFVREQNLRNVGLMFRDNLAGADVEHTPAPHEYQLWVLLKRGGTDVRLEHVEVGNVSASAVPDPATGVTPAAVIRVRSGTEPPRAGLRAAGGVYVRRWSLDPVEVHVREPGRAQAVARGK